MSTAMQQLLESFDALPELDRHQAAVEILRRVLADVEGDVPEAGLVEAAEELFRALDTEEASHAPNGRGY
jgi:methylmalonyl-CoA mutase cobalamin-binding subunit